MQQWSVTSRADMVPVHACRRLRSRGAGRAINRHKFTLEEAEANLERPVVRALLQLMRFRNTHPAFNGQVSFVARASHFRCATRMVLEESHTMHKAVRRI